MPSVSQRHVEPDAEPTPVEPDVADLSDPPHAAPTGPSTLPAGPLAGLPFDGKPKRKDLPIASFSGRTQPHGFDSGVHAFRKRFLKELVTVQLLDGHRFTEQQCLALFILCLDGDASVYMNNVQLRQPDLTLDQAGALLVNRFSSMLPTSTILDIICASTKGATETYQQFAVRLLDMAEALPGGTEVETNGSVVLETFVEKAHWRFSAQLGGFVRAHLALKASHLNALDAAVQELTQIAKSDGSQESLSRLASSAPKRRKTNDGQPTAAASGAAMAAVVERKQKPSGGRWGGQGRGRGRGRGGRGGRGHPAEGRGHTSRADAPATPNTTCFLRGAKGHKSFECPTNTNAEHKLQGAVLAAVTDDE
ncbi:hypothetical protein PR003_g21139 [Phytophthora rubi]|uniref:Uncharacterized protein n=1 Tax=Phytophthora rubi TaxID=129364 RepID=A0A6A4DGV6_9STRA|nr:hypothetical protein PR003_g21139 [Phytophthora rubi]